MVKEVHDEEQRTAAINEKEEKKQGEVSGISSSISDIIRMMCIIIHNNKCKKLTMCHERVEKILLNAHSKQCKWRRQLLELHADDDVMGDVLY